MPEHTLQWGAEALWQQLEPLLPGLSVEVVHSTISTNTALLDRARVVQESELEAGNVQVRRSVESGAFGRRAVDVQPCLLVAENQIGGRVFIKALRAIKPGEELFYDYGLIIDERYTPKLKKQFECRCGTRGCRGTMLAPKR